jgi:WD40 repeat protein
VSFSGDGARLVVAEVFGGTAVVFDRATPTELGSRELCGGFVSTFAILETQAGNASMLGTCLGPSSTTQYVVDSASLGVRMEVPDQTGIRSALSSDGRWVASMGAADSAGQVTVWDTTTGSVVSRMEPLPQWPMDLDFSPDASLLAMGADADAVFVWDVETGEILERAKVPHHTAGPDQVLDVEFSPEGDRLAAAFVWTPKELWMISTDDWRPLASYEAPEQSTTAEAPALNLHFTPDGATLIATDFSALGEGRIVFMDGVSLDHIAEIPDAHRGGVADLALNEGGTLLASAGLDGVVRVWDVATRDLLHEIPVSREAPGVGGVAFAEDERHLLVTSMVDGTLRKVTTDTAELLDIARSRVTRTFTDTECSVYRIDPCPSLEEVRAG